MKHFELTVADHDQNGFHALAVFPSFNDDKIKDDFGALNKLFPQEEFDIAKAESHSFLIDIRDSDGDLYDQITVPLQFANLIAEDAVREWQNKRPNPDDALMSGHMPMCLSTWPVRL